MDRRSDRYETNEEALQKHSRVQKNKCLYDDINSKIGYEEITSFDDNAIDLSSINMNKPSRENYQKLKEYKGIFIGENPKEEVEVKEEKNKTFDINKVLEEAKKNRANDELESKRNISDKEYNVLNSLNKKYLHKKDFSKEDDDELKDLINTITSKTLVDDCKDEEEKELLSDLLASTIDIKIESQMTQEEINRLYEKGSLDDTDEVEFYKDEDDFIKPGEKDDEDEDSDDTSTMEQTFFTHSMELSSDDILTEKEIENDEEEDIDESVSTVRIALIVAILLVVIAIIVFVLLRKYGILG